MKRLSLDFDNHCLCIMMPGQEGTQIIPELKKEDFENFIPWKFKDRSSFTWDFEAESISINQPYKAIDIPSAVPVCGEAPRQKHCNGEEGGP